MSPVLFAALWLAAFVILGGSIAYGRLLLKKAIDSERERPLDWIKYYGVCSAGIIISTCIVAYSLHL